jgi:hypothetical protein
MSHFFNPKVPSECFTEEQEWMLSQHLDRFKVVAVRRSTLDIFLLILGGGSSSRRVQTGRLLLVLCPLAQPSSGWLTHGSG